MELFEAVRNPIDELGRTVKGQAIFEPLTADAEAVGAQRRASAKLKHAAELVAHRRRLQANRNVAATGIGLQIGEKGDVAYRKIELSHHAERQFKRNVADRRGAEPIACESRLA